MKRQKYIDLAECGATHDLNKYISAGWTIVHSGLTLIILEREI